MRGITVLAMLSLVLIMAVGLSACGDFRRNDGMGETWKGVREVEVIRRAPDGGQCVAPCPSTRQ